MSLPGVFEPIEQLRHWLEARIARQESGCWLWTGIRNYAGYGCLKRGGKQFRAHRIVYEAFKGSIPAGLVMDHLCRNRSCVNPAHLEPVTDRTNILRGTAISAQYAARSFCSKGHPFTPDNVYQSALQSGRRQCKICLRNAVKRYRARKAEKDNG